MNAFKTCFKHRVNAFYEDGQFLNLHDAINPSLARAAALADLIEVACERGDTSAFYPDTLWRAAQSIRFEIRDAQLLIKKYMEAEKVARLKSSTLEDLS